MNRNGLFYGLLGSAPYVVFYNGGWETWPHVGGNWKQRERLGRLRDGVFTYLALDVGSEFDKVP
jgi:hypothetical protein